MPPDQVKSITISGFKSIKHARIELGPLNVLIGANGSGKSNLASAFRLLQAWFSQLFELQAFVADCGGANALLRFGAKHTDLIEIDVEFLGKSNGPIYHLPLRPSATDQLYISTVDNPGFVANPDSELAKSLNLKSHFIARLKVAHFHDTTPKSRIRLTSDLHDNRSLHPDGRNLAAFLYKLQQTKLEHFRLIESTTRLVATFFNRFSLAPDGLNPNSVRLRWREVGADEDFGVELLSDGTLRFIALATMLLQPKENLPSLLFIDEPELGLHPYAITVLAGLIRQASHDCQIIAATQSPTFLDHFDPKDVIVVERDDRATTFKRLEPRELAEWLEEYSLGELWEKNIIGGRPRQ